MRECFCCTVGSRDCLRCSGCDRTVIDRDFRAFNVRLRIREQVGQEVDGERRSINRSTRPTVFFAQAQKGPWWRYRGSEMAKDRRRTKTFLSKEADRRGRC